MSRQLQFNEVIFLNFFNWHCENNEDVNKVVNLNVLRNNQLTAPKIQKDIINTYVTEMRKATANELEDKFISFLIDETRDSSVKEQMSLVLRFANDKGEVIEHFL